MREASGFGGAARMSKAVALLFASRIVCFALGFLQMLLLAKKFGASHITDAFLVAEGCHLFFLGVVESNLALVLIPVFIEHREKGDHEGAWRVASALRSVSVVFLGVITVLLFALAPQVMSLLAPGFSPEASRLAATLMRWMSPLAILVLVSGFYATLYLALDRYAMPAWTAVLGYAGGPVSLLLFGDKLGIYALPAGILGGYVARLLVLFLGFRERGKLRWVVDLRHSGVRQLGKMAVPRFLVVSLVQVNLFVDKFFASYLSAGCISALTYGSKCLTVPVRLAINPLAGVLMPEISRCATRRDIRRLQQIVLRTAALLGFVVIPVMAFIAGFRYELLNLVLGRGAFQQRAIDLTATALLCYSFGMISYFLNPILDGLFFALQKAAVPLRVLALTSLLNAVLDFLLMKWLGHGGIALATSIVITTNTVVLWKLAGNDIGDGLPTRKLILVLGRTLLATLAVGVVLWWLMAMPGSIMARANPRPWIRMGAAALGGGVLYLGLQAILNRPVLMTLVRTVLRIGGRRREKPGDELAVPPEANPPDGT